MTLTRIRTALASAVLALAGPTLPLAATAIVDNGPAGPGWAQSCTLLLDAASGQVLRRDGGADCAQRQSPFSTFKLPLAVIGFDAGVLKDGRTPRWDYKAEFQGYAHQRHATDPSSWLSESIVWYSQELTRKLGVARFEAYVARLGYGNRDVRGGPKPGDDGLTHAWLGSSLAISADEQAEFVRRLLADQLPLPAQAQAQTRAIVPAFAADGGWLLHGKTGSGSLRDSKGQPDRQRPVGWFVGWAEKDGRRIVFARMAVGTRTPSEGLGLVLRAALLKDWPGLVPAAPAPGATAAGAIAPCGDNDDWNLQAPPRRIHGNSWYVGTCGLSSILVTSPNGHVLLDGTTPASAARVADSIRRLGFRVEDLRYILNSHAHDDHAGGIAQLQQWSGATVVSRGDDADALLRGKGSRSDPQQLIGNAFPPVTGSLRRVQDGDTLRLGEGASALAITIHATPGHTPGSTSYTWVSCGDAGRNCLRMVYADSVTAYTDKQYRYGDEASHPGVVAAFRRSLATVAALPCDVLMTPHPSASQLWQRLDGTDGSRLVDTAACRRYAQRAGRGLDEFLAKEVPGG